MPGTCTRNDLSERHYRGVRMRRWGKWVSEIRDPQKKKRIWLGSFRSVTEAAHAFDAAALMCLKGSNSKLNFPDHNYRLPPGSPGNYTTREIQAAAAASAAASVGRSFSYDQFMPSTSSSDSDDGAELEDITYTGVDSNARYSSSSHSISYCESWTNLEEDPTLVSEMARGMLMHPPCHNDEDEDDDEYGYNGSSLWN